MGLFLPLSWVISEIKIRFKHSKMHRDKRAPGIRKPSRGSGGVPQSTQQPQNPPTLFSILLTWKTLSQNSIQKINDEIQ